MYLKCCDACCLNFMIFDHLFIQHTYHIYSWAIDMFYSNFKLQTVSFLSPRNLPDKAIMNAFPTQNDSASIIQIMKINASSTLSIFLFQSTRALCTKHRYNLYSFFRFILVKTKDPIHIGAGRFWYQPDAGISSCCT